MVRKGKVMRLQIHHLVHTKKNPTVHMRICGFADPSRLPVKGKYDGNNLTSRPWQDKPFSTLREATVYHDECANHVSNFTKDCGIPPEFEADFWGNDARFQKSPSPDAVFCFWHDDSDITHPLRSHREAKRVANLAAASQIVNVGGQQIERWELHPVMKTVDQVLNGNIENPDAELMYFGTPSVIQNMDKETIKANVLKIIEVDSIHHGFLHGWFTPAELVEG